MNERELYHFGIKGMKWGVWNADTKAKYLNQNIKGGKDKPAKSRLEVLTKTASDIVDSGKNVSDSAYSIANRSKIAKARADAKKEVSNLSDEELRKRINRANLEKQYADIKASEVQSGSITVSDILSVLGSMAAISAGIATVASTVYMAKNGKV